jgi:hypothetical protein
MDRNSDWNEGLSLAWAHIQTDKVEVNFILYRWYNQLSPCITRSPWTVEEENILFISHSKLGNRWKDIAKIIRGRTDNSVKNHFYSTVRRSLRRLDKHFGFKDSTKKMRSLKPAALTLLLETARTLSDYKCKPFKIQKWWSSYCSSLNGSRHSATHMLFPMAGKYTRTLLSWSIPLSDYLII